MSLTVSPYSVLAAGYDVVMAHVDYDGWVTYVDKLIGLHGGPPRSVIELGCGTGTFAVAFSKRFDVPYLATDLSGEMLDVARRKNNSNNNLISFEKIDFSALHPDRQYDLAILLYDGLNYLTDLDRVRDLFRAVGELLLPGGRFIFDQATPVNSLNHAALFEDVGVCQAFSYVRKSRYRAESGLHETIFELENAAGSFTEYHVQRPYRLNEIRDILTRSPLEELAAYADFTLKQVDESTERIHWVTRKRLL